MKFTLLLVPENPRPVSDRGGLSKKHYVGVANVQEVAIGKCLLEVKRMPHAPLTKSVETVSCSPLQRGVRHSPPAAN